MESGKFDSVQLLMQPYVLDLLHALEKPKRFNDLRKYVKNGRTLSLKLSKLLKFELIEIKPLRTNERYVNSYLISDKGMRLVKKLEHL